MRFPHLLLMLLLIALAAQAQPISCVAQAGQPSVRPLSRTELVSDVVITCIGGAAGPPATFNFQIELNVPITSRVLQTFTDASEALMLIDDPAPGSQLVQPVGVTTPGASVFQARRLGNLLRFENVSFSLPGSGQRTIRIVNVRADVTSLTPQNPVTMNISVGGTTSLPILNSVGLFVASVGGSSDFAVRNPDDTATFSGTFDGCAGNKINVNANTPRDFNIKFIEGFASDFKKRNIATSPNSPTAVADQNLPGTLYFTESGFVNTFFTNLNSLNQAGLASQGTRLMATFTNIPPGVNIYVTTTQVQQGTSTTPIAARLIQTDATGTGAFSAAPAGAGSYSQRPVVGGTAVAVWEILDADITALESISFGVLISVPAGSTGTGLLNVAGQRAPVSAVSSTSPYPGFANAPVTLQAGSFQGCVAPLTIFTGCPLQPATLGNAYSVNLTATGGVIPYTWAVTIGTLPPGLTLTPAGLISGTPVQNGTFPFTIRVTDSATTAVTRECSITVAAAISISSACPLPEGLFGVQYAHLLSATGGTPPYRWSITQGVLPPGVFLAATGTITGIPASAGLFSFTLLVTDQLGATGRLDCALRIALPFTAEPLTLSFTASSGRPANATQLISVTKDNVSTPMSVRVTTTSGGNWLTATLLSPTIPGFVEVSATAAILTPGTYEGFVIIFTQGAVQQSSSVTVRFTVLAPITSELSANPPALAVPRGAGPRLRTLEIFNIGSGSLNFAAGIEFLNGQGWLSLTPSSGSAAPGAPGRLRAVFQTAALDPGSYRARIRVVSAQARQDLIIPVAVTVSSGRDALTLSHSGLGFQSVFLGSVPSPQSFHILSTGANAFNWTASIAVDAGLPNWLSLSETSGAASPGNPSRVEVRINPIGLTAGRYFGEVIVRAQGVDNSPRILFVVLNVLANTANPGLTFMPSGLLFLANPARPIPPPQSFTVHNPSNTTARYDFHINGDTRTWTVTGPPDRSLAPGASAQFNVAANTANVPPGAFRASVNFQVVNDPVARQLELLLIVGSQAPRTASIQRTAEAVCPPGGLQVQLLRQAIGFSSVTGIPLAVDARVASTVDGAPVTTGVVTATLAGAANATTHLVHIDSDPGLWSGTLLPPASSTALALRLFADDPSRNATGCIDMPGTSNGGQAPVISEGGIVSTSSFAAGVPLSPGGMAALFGSRLADGSASAATLPLPTQLGVTRVSIAGRPVPLFFAGDLTTFSQINGILPYGLTPNIAHQLSLRRAGQLAFSEILLTEAQPGLFSVAQSGAGQGVIVHGLNPLLIADRGNPVGRGEVVVIYCEGLGPVDPAIEAGQQTPDSPLRRVSLPLRVTIGGQEAVVQFAGLTPGLSGLYQINAVVPDSASTGDAVPVAITVAGQQSNTVTIALRP